MINLNDKNYLSPGEVVLVGAGPGDPDLLTIAAVKAINSADVVVYDALISPEILELLPDNCEKVFAGKRGGSPSTSQADISDTLVQLARKNMRVVRLKGGDPFMFGRGGEEALRLVADGVPFRIIPGLSSGMAGPAYAGIPITHRTVNANIGFLTGHEKAQNPPFGQDETASRIDWEAVGRAFPVLVIYMAMSNLKTVTKRLMEAGRSEDTPVAIIQWATTPRQRTLVTTLGDAEKDVTAGNVKSPAIIVVGKVVDYREELAWFKDETVEIDR